MEQGCFAECFFKRENHRSLSGSEPKPRPLRPALAIYKTVPGNQRCTFPNVPVNRLCGPEWKGVAFVSWLQTGAAASNALRSYYSKGSLYQKRYPGCDGYNVLGPRYFATLPRSLGSHQSHVSDQKSQRPELHGSLTQTFYILFAFLAVGRLPESGAGQMWVGIQTPTPYDFKYSTAGTL